MNPKALKSRVYLKIVLTELFSYGITELSPEPWEEKLFIPLGMTFHMHFEMREIAISKVYILNDTYLG